MKFETMHAPDRSTMETATAAMSQPDVRPHQMAWRGEPAATQAHGGVDQSFRMDVIELATSRQALHANHAHNRLAVRHLYRKAVDVKCGAARGNLPVLVEIAGSLCDFIEAMNRMQRPSISTDGMAMAALDMHIESMSLALDRDLRGPLSSLEWRMIHGLARAAMAMAVTQPARMTDRFRAKSRSCQIESPAAGNPACASR